MKDLTLQAIPENTRVVTEFIEEELEALDAGMKAVIQINVAIDEIFSNIANYAYQGSEGMATVRLEFDEAARQASITFIDEGVAYNPLEKEDPDTSLSADERPIGGLGIYMVKNIMDDVRYEYADGKNMLTIVKTI